MKGLRREWSFIEVCQRHSTSPGFTEYLRPMQTCGRDCTPAPGPLTAAAVLLHAVALRLVLMHRSTPNTIRSLSPHSLPFSLAASQLCCQPPPSPSCSHPPAYGCASSRSCVAMSVLAVS